MQGHKIVQVFADVRHIRWSDTEDLFDIAMVFDNLQSGHDNETWVDANFQKVLTRGIQWAAGQI